MDIKKRDQFNWFLINIFKNSTLDWLKKDLDWLHMIIAKDSREAASAEAVAQSCSVKKVFLEILQNSQWVLRKF